MNKKLSKCASKCASKCDSKVSVCLYVFHAMELLQSCGRHVTINVFLIPVAKFLLFIIFYFTFLLISHLIYFDFPFFWFAELC